MILEEIDAPATPPPAPPPAPAPAPEPSAENVLIACPECGKKYRVPSSTIGRTAACSQCDTKFSVTPSHR